MLYLIILVTIRKVLVTVRKIWVSVRKVLARWLSITSHHYSPILRMPQMVCEIWYAGKHYALIYACFLGFFPVSAMKMIQRLEFTWRHSNFWPTSGTVIWSKYMIHSFFSFLLSSFLHPFAAFAFSYFY